MSHGVNVASKSDKQLADLQADIMREQALRRRLDASPEKIENAISEYQKAHHVGEGEPWVQPVTALQAYRMGAEVEDDGKHWVSTVPNNVWRPGVSGWRLKAEVDPETGKEVPPPYVQPSGNHDSYGEGEAITWIDGEIYTAARDGVVHSPDEHPDDWNHVVPATPIEPAEPIESDPEPEPPEDEDEGGQDDGDQDEDESGEEPAEPELDEWQSASHSYTAGDTFTFDGDVYRVRQDHTSAAHWPPSAVPALYERL